MDGERVCYLRLRFRGDGLVCYLRLEALGAGGSGRCALSQGLTLVNFSAQLERFVWDRGCA